MDGGDIRIQETNGLIIAAPGIRTIGGNGDISVDVVVGDLGVYGPVTANGGGRVTLAANAGLLTQDVGRTISSTSGDIGISAADFHQNGAVLTGSIGSITVSANIGNIVMSNAAETQTLAGSIHYGGVGGVVLGLLRSESGDISVSSSLGAITENTGGESSNIVTTGAVALSAATGIGAAGFADIDTTIGSLTGHCSGGDIWIQETAGLTIGGVGLHALGANRSININVAASDLWVDGPVTAQGGSVNLNVVSGNITMTSGTKLSTLGGKVDLTVSGAILLSSIEAGGGDIQIIAGLSILDNSNDEGANLATTGTVSLAAGTGIGTIAAGDIDTEIGILMASTSLGDIWLQESGGLVIGGSGLRTLGGDGNINVNVASGL
jgi:hypothetical protein